jgi:hypothetical protein
MPDLWQRYSALAGMPPEFSNNLLANFEEIVPRDEAVGAGFLRRAGFGQITEPFSPLIHGSWGARKKVYPLPPG